MEPGIELDDLVATKVMGWKWNHKKNWYDTPDNSPRYGYTAEDGYYSGLGGVPFSRSISAALEVVEHIKRDYFCFDLLWSGKNEKWQCIFPQKNDPKNYMGEQKPVFSDTPAHAICIAALRAKGFDV